jgi:phosphoribosylaminoimidazole carboxylase (NCAIR synthetase)
VAPILPGAVVGVLGSGQLGRMFAIAARQMGYRVHTFSPETDTPTGQVADVEITAAYDDLDAIRDFAENVHVLTFELRLRHILLRCDHPVQSCTLHSIACARNLFCNKTDFPSLLSGR